MVETNDRRLPVGIQSFEEIREQGYLYVDNLFETCWQNMKYLLQVLFCFGKNEINIFLRVIIENDNPIFLLF